MSPALIALIAQAILQYGLPAVIQIINNMQKPNPTEADWAQAFALAQTPYGLTPNAAILGTDAVPLGNLQTPVAVSTDAVPAGFDTPGRPNVAAVKVKVQGAGRVVCNAAGDCWVFPDVARIPIETVANGQIWGSGVNRFFIPTAFLA